MCKREKESVCVREREREGTTERERESEPWDYYSSSPFLGDAETSPIYIPSKQEKNATTYRLDPLSLSHQTPTKQARKFVGGIRRCYVSLPQLVGNRNWDKTNRCSFFVFPQVILSIIKREEEKIRRDVG